MVERGKVLPEGIERRGEVLVVGSLFRRPVEFDDVLPGDLLVYRGDYGQYYFVHSKTRDHMSGWHFGSQGGPGGWGHDHSSFKSRNVKVDRISPGLLPLIAQHYEVRVILDALQNGDFEAK